MLNLIVVGIGNIGRYWLEHFAPQLPASVRIHALANSKGLSVVSQATPLLLQVPDKGVADPALITRQIELLEARDELVAVVDLTASKEISRCYVRWIQAGAHLISANKYAGSSALDWYRKIREALKTHDKHWFCNTTVGAGLPIQKAIQERLQCHDPILSIEGNFSGSLSWIFQQLKPDERLSDWLHQAAEAGMTEPDPRIDLSGMDVGRKLLILAREAGWELELADIDIQSLVPESLKNVSLESFWQRVTEVDAQIGAAPQYHYLGRIELDGEKPKASARLTQIDTESAYAHLPPGNANFIIRSQAYDANPLVIQGPGAGREVTASGVYSDVLDLVNLLGSGTMSVNNLPDSAKPKQPELPSTHSESDEHCKSNLQSDDTLSRRSASSRVAGSQAAAKAFTRN